MLLTKILRPEAVKVLSGASSKKRLFHGISELTEQVHDLPAGQTANALMERESLGSTGVGHGVALPHARMAALSQVVGVFVLLDKPIDFGAVDRQPVDIAFALFAPEDAGVDHLKALALVSRTLRDAALCDKLRANNDPVALYALLTSGQSVQAA
ncbi:MAG: PTS sugar transporter subunit IIA [Rhodobacteraceae bacterium]|nr:PTS sugar transporter subunit IIA [Paracoccaceae bacterium]